jgi:hypothetical protein
MFNNSLQETIYQHNRSTVPADILGFYYLQKWDKDSDIYNYDNGWKISYKQIRTPISITQDVTNALDDFVVDLSTTGTCSAGGHTNQNACEAAGETWTGNFEPDRDCKQPQLVLNFI